MSAGIWPSQVFIRISLLVICFVVMSSGGECNQPPEYPADPPDANTRSVHIEYDWMADHDLLSDYNNSGEFLSMLNNLFQNGQGARLNITLGSHGPQLEQPANPSAHLFSSYPQDRLNMIEYASEFRSCYGCYDPAYPYHILSLDHLDYPFFPNTMAWTPISDPAGSNANTPISKESRCTYIFTGDIRTVFTEGSPRKAAMAYFTTHELGHQITSLTHPEEYYEYHLDTYDDWDIMRYYSASTITQPGFLDQIKFCWESSEANCIYFLRSVEPELRSTPSNIYCDPEFCD